MISCVVLGFTGWPRSRVCLEGSEGSQVIQKLEMCELGFEVFGEVLAS